MATYPRYLFSLVWHKAISVGVLNENQSEELSVKIKFITGVMLCSLYLLNIVLCQDALFMELS